MNIRIVRTVSNSIRELGSGMTIRELGSEESGRNKIIGSFGVKTIQDVSNPIIEYYA